jgi:hypothetical protein
MGTALFAVYEKSLASLLCSREMIVSKKATLGEVSEHLAMVRFYFYLPED